MRIVAFEKSGISYNDALYKAVESQDVTVVQGYFAGGWLLRNLRGGDWVHLHWPSFQYSVKGSTIACIRGLVRWFALLALIRLRGAHIVWTAHNLLPHDRHSLPWVDPLARRIVIALSRKIMVHGPSAAQELCTRFPSASRKIAQMQMGNWVDYYPVTTTREAARAHLNIAADTYVYLFIGLCKPYKNLHGLITAFRALTGNSTLLVAGKFQDPNYQKHVEALAAGDARIRIIPGFVPDDMIQTYLVACDAVVAPYNEILTSGTAMLALSFGRPIISVNRGFLKDVVTEKTGLLFSPETDGGLTKALAAVQEKRFEEGEILDHARKFTYEDAACKLISSLGAE
jgi:beta-1,4-mannosyltransferase